MSPTDLAGTLIAWLQVACAQGGKRVVPCGKRCMMVHGTDGCYKRIVKAAESSISRREEG